MNQTDEIIADLQRSAHGCYIRNLENLAIAEIERLRASQFRWIPVSEQRPDAGSVIRFVRMQGGDFTTWVGEIRPFDHVTHWAPIPPLPEKTQEQKDEELWVKFRCSSNAPREEHGKACFLAGLKASRASREKA